MFNLPYKTVSKEILDLNRPENRNNTSYIFLLSSTYKSKKDINIIFYMILYKIGTLNYWIYAVLTRYFLKAGKIEIGIEILKFGIRKEVVGYEKLVPFKQILEKYMNDLVSSQKDIDKSEKDWSEEYEQKLNKITSHKMIFSLSDILPDKFTVFNESFYTNSKSHKNDILYSKISDLSFSEYRVLKINQEKASSNQIESSESILTKGQHFDHSHRSLSDQKNIESPKNTERKVSSLDESKDTDHKMVDEKKVKFQKTTTVFPLISRRHVIDADSEQIKEENARQKTKSIFIDTFSHDQTQSSVKSPSSHSNRTFEDHESKRQHISTDLFDKSLILSDELMKEPQTSISYLSDEKTTIKVQETPVLEESDIPNPEMHSEGTTASLLGHPSVQGNKVQIANFLKNEDANCGSPLEKDQETVNHSFSCDISYENCKIQSKNFKEQPETDDILNEEPQLESKAIDILDMNPDHKNKKAASATDENLGTIQSREGLDASINAQHMDKTSDMINLAVFSNTDDDQSLPLKDPMSYEQTNNKSNCNNQIRVDYGAQEKNQLFPLESDELSRQDINMEYKKVDEKNQLFPKESDELSRQDINMKYKKFNEKNSSYEYSQKVSCKIDEITAGPQEKENNNFENRKDPSLVEKENINFENRKDPSLVEKEILCDLESEKNSNHRDRNLILAESKNLALSCTDDQKGSPQKSKIPSLNQVGAIPHENYSSNISYCKGSLLLSTIPSGPVERSDASMEVFACEKIDGFNQEIEIQDDFENGEKEIKNEISQSKLVLEIEIDHDPDKFSAKSSDSSCKDVSPRRNNTNSTIDQPSLDITQENVCTAPQISCDTQFQIKNTVEITKIESKTIDISEESSWITDKNSNFVRLETEMTDTKRINTMETVEDRPQYCHTSEKSPRKEISTEMKPSDGKSSQVGDSFNLDLIEANGSRKKDIDDNNIYSNIHRSIVTNSKATKELIKEGDILTLLPEGKGTNSVTQQKNSIDTGISSIFLQEEKIKVISTQTGVQSRVEIFITGQIDESNNEDICLETTEPSPIIQQAEEFEPEIHQNMNQGEISYQDGDTFHISNQKFIIQKTWNEGFIALNTETGEIYQFCDHFTRTPDRLIEAIGVLIKDIKSHFLFGQKRYYWPESNLDVHLQMASDEILCYFMLQILCLINEMIQFDVFINFDFNSLVVEDDEQHFLVKVLPSVFESSCSDKNSLEVENLSKWLKQLNLDDQDIEQLIQKLRRRLAQIDLNRFISQHRENYTNIRVKLSDFSS